MDIGHTRVKDFSALKHLNLEMLGFVNSGNRVSLTEEYWAGVQTVFPDCWITFNPLYDNEANPYAVGWRLNATGGYTPIYRKVRDVFGYDEINKVLQNK